RLCEERILTLGQVVEVCGPRLDNAAGLASRLSLRSVRVVSLLLQSWKQQLSQSELALIAAHLKTAIISKHPSHELRLLRHEVSINAAVRRLH
ncbi:hypothetical protein JOQ06_001961, partial [Pogonophryne albipinna]